jgi:hypothetical protein
MTTATARKALKEVRSLIADARRDWLAWKLSIGLSHIDYYTVCPATVGHGECPGPGCEGCLMEGWRAERRERIEAETLDQLRAYWKTADKHARDVIAEMAEAFKRNPGGGRRAR